MKKISKIAIILLIILQEAVNTLVRKTGLKPDDIVLTGFRNGKFIFVPLADLP
jgi:hypothetical protein